LIIKIKNILVIGGCGFVESYISIFLINNLINSSIYSLDATA